MCAPETYLLAVATKRWRWNIPLSRKPRVHVFVDFWNFQLTMKKIDEQFSADFRALGPVLVDAAMAIVDSGVQAEYAGMVGSRELKLSKAVARANARWLKRLPRP